MRFHAVPDPAEVRGLGVSHGDHEVGAGEHVQLAELDPLVHLDVASRPEHREQHVAVALQLRALVSGDGVLDRQVVDSELSSNRPYFAGVGTVQPDPAHPLLLTQQLIGQFQGRRLRPTTPVHVHGVIHDCHQHLPSRAL